jgi:hypothetical protein
MDLSLVDVDLGTGQRTTIGAVLPDESALRTARPGHRRPRVLDAMDDVQIDPSGRFTVAVGEGSIYVFDARTGRATVNTPRDFGVAGAATAVSFVGPDAALIATHERDPEIQGGAGAARVFRLNLDSLRSEATTPVAEAVGPVEFMSLDPSREMVLMGERHVGLGDTSVQVMNLADGRRIFERHHAGVAVWTGTRQIHYNYRDRELCGIHVEHADAQGECAPAPFGKIEAMTFFQASQTLIRGTSAVVERNVLHDLRAEVEVEVATAPTCATIRRIDVLGGGEVLLNFLPAVVYRVI